MLVTYRDGGLFYIPFTLYKQTFIALALLKII